MGLPANFVKSIPRISRVIRYTEAHRDIRYPVDIDRIIKDLIIEIEVKPFEEDVTDGYCIPGNSQGVGRKIFINANKPVEVRRKAKAHELHHILEHGKFLPLYSHVDQVDKILEREANYAAAFYLVPARCIKLAGEWGVNHQELAERMDVPLDLVMKRYEIYLELKEHKSDLEFMTLPMVLDSD
jgi:Zn-dependent peptidase ImmA (M78 family)